MNAPHSALDAVTLRGIRKSYVMGGQPVPALKGVDLTVQRGEFVALTGPSGSGKSTLLNVCGLLDAPDEGSVALGDQDMTTLSDDALALVRREHIGFVFQGFNLVPVMTVYENVEFPLYLQGVRPDQRRSRVAETLARVGLQDFARRLPDELSGGQRQRVAIARALVKAAAIVVADEPTANLDSVNAAQVVELLRRLASEQGLTCVIATHDPRVSDHCDRVVRLVDGVIA
jgi:putative ABC transport system ATP-binding protein